MTRLRVGLNLVFLGEHSGGIGRISAELLVHLARRDDVEVHAFTSRDEPRGLRERAPGARFTQFPVRTSGPPLHLLGGYGGVPALAIARRLDVVHSPANAGPVRIPGVRSVITVHDALWLQAGDEWDTPRAQSQMRRIAVPTARRADRIITASEDAATVLTEMLGLDRARIDIVPHGVHVPATPPTPEPELRERLGLGKRRVVLCIAQKRPYKNQDKLIRALAHLPDDVALVLPGAPTAFEEDLRALAAQTDRQVVFPEWVSEADLEGLYGLAACVALPSRLEGFGLPVLEAMARGVPVVASNRSSVPEVVADAGLMADPDDIEALAGAIRRVLDEPGLANDLVARGLARAAQYTWERTAQMTVETYRRALAR